MRDAASPLSATEPRSRRAVLAAAAGGAAAIAAALARPAPAKAAAGSALIIGSSTNNAGTSNTVLTTNSSVVAFELIQHGPGTALMGYATPTTGATRGVYGRTDSSTGDGVQARNAAAHGTGAAIRAFGGHNYGVIATSDTFTAIYGSSTDYYGVFGESTNNIGVVGISQNDTGVYGASAYAFAGYFSGPVGVTRYIEVAELTSAPASPLSNAARIFVRDVGGKTQVCAKFSNGSIVVMAAQP